jgi:hypothetical protein
MIRNNMQILVTVKNLQGWKLCVILLLLMSSLLTGCVTSPVDTRRAGAIDPTGLLLTGAGAAGGAVIGNEIAPGGLGSAVGAGIGAVGMGALAGAAVQYTNRQKAEAFERGKRAARLEVMKQYWEEQTETITNDSAGNGDRPVRSLKYDSGVYEGMRVGNITRTVPVGPYEPIRATGSP